MKNFILFAVLLFTSAFSYSQTGVYINDILIEKEKIKEFETTYQITIPDGRYWYDKECGVWGLEGGPTKGVLQPNWDIGTLKSDASNGDTGIFLNGREVHREELTFFQPLVYLLGGNRIWINNKGDIGLEGQPKKFNMKDFAKN